MSWINIHNRRRRQRWQRANRVRCMKLRRESLGFQRIAEKPFVYSVPVRIVREGYWLRAPYLTGGF